MGKTSTSHSRGLLWKGMRLFGVVVSPMVKKLQRINNLSSSLSSGDEKGIVKQGHFVVIATQGCKAEKFFIELGYLDHPDFVKLLKQAEEEYGFSHVGAIAIPCDPEHLKRIIGRRNNKKAEELKSDI